MVSLDKINLEYKSTVLFGFIALILSFLTGFLAGIRWNIVFLRSFILMAVFAVIGYGACMIIRKFVPEVYEFLASVASRHIKGENGEETESDNASDMEKTDTEAEEGGETVAAEASPDAVSPHEFAELEKESLAHYSTSPGGGSSVNTKTGKLGKHILETEKIAKYEPKIMAQAVRTMMSKDKE